MDIIKKIALILPVLAVIMFIYTLSTLKGRNGIPAAVSLNKTEITTAVSVSEKPFTLSSVTSVSSSRATTVTTTLLTSLTSSVHTTFEETTVTSAPDEGKITFNVVTPFSKTPGGQPPERIQPQPVETPADLVIQSIPLINNNTETTVTTTCTEVPETTCESLADTLEEVFNGDTE